MELKNLIERHFESAHPRARHDLGGVIPGALLLEQHRQGLRNGRLRALQNVGSHAQVLASAAPLPGIALRSDMPAGSLPTAVATGDFNNDGHMDFAVANGLTNDVWLYLGKGDGTFQNPRIVPLSKGLAPVSIAAADLRGNGKLDLILGEFDSTSIGVLPGNGDGTFGYETTYSLPGPTESIVVDDFNHDGRLDVAALIVETSGIQVPYIALLKGDGTGALSAPIISYNWGFISGAWNIASGDVNGDGLPDLLITGPGWPDDSTIYLNNGDGTFRQGQIVIAYDGLNMLLDGRIADINGDHCADAVIADGGSAVYIALGDCSGNFATPTFFMMGDSNAAVRVTDVNGDGIPDLVTSALPALNPVMVGQIAGNTLSIALGTGKGNFAPPRNYIGTSEAFSIGIADFNGDGKPDFVTANSDSDTVNVYRNDGIGGFGFPQGVYAGVSGQGVTNAPVASPSFLDLNNDGKTDVFLLDEGYYGEYFATSLLNDGTGRFSGPVSSDLGISVTANWIGDHRVGNFRDAQHLDLVAIGLDQTSTVSGQFILFAPGNGDGTFGKSTLLTVTGADGIMTTGDFNHDGKLDFVAVNGGDAHILTTFLGNGDGTFHGLAPITFTDPVGDGFGTEPVRAYTADFNRDGKLDVFVFTTGNGYGTTASTVWEFDGKGDGTFQPGRQLYTNFGPLTVADINGDSFPDMVRYWGEVPNGTNAIPLFINYLDQPNGGFTQISSYAPYAGVPLSVLPYAQNGDPTSSSLVADLQGTGKPDEVALQAVSPNPSLQYAQIMMGNGDGTFTPSYDIFPFYIDNAPLYAHDLDGDGVADMVSSIAGTSSLQVYKGTRAPALQIELADSIVLKNGSCGWVFPDVASSSDRTVSLSSSISGVLLPTTVTIPSGALSTKFCYTLATSFDRHQVFDINAQLNGDTATAYASASYVVGFDETLTSPPTSTVYPGQSVGPISITLTPAQGYSSTVHLSCQDLPPGDTCQFGSNSLTLPASGSVSTTLTLIIGPDSGTYGLNPIITLVADDGNVLKRQSIPVHLVVLSLFPLGSGVAQTVSPSSTSLQLYVSGIAPLTFGCAGLPAGVSCTFTNPVNTLSTLTITVPSGVAAGNYLFQINLSSGSYQAATAATLQIISVSVQPTSSSDQSGIPGTSKTLSITAQEPSSLNTNVQIACALDVAGSTCGSGSVSLNPGNLTASTTVVMTLPANASLGQHQLTLTSTFAGFTQTSAFPFIVADFSGTLSTSSITVANGGSGTATATLNGTTGFSGQISLSCSGSAVRCSFSPKTAQLIGGTAQTDTITFTAPTISAATRDPLIPLSSNALMLVLVLPICLTRSMRRRPLCLWIGLFLLITGISACGGAGTGSSGSGGGGGTTNYSVSISAIETTTGATRTLGNVTVTVTR